jgi:hypothetical protein
MIREDANVRLLVITGRTEVFVQKWTYKGLISKVRGAHPCSPNIHHPVERSIFIRSTASSCLLNVPRCSSPQIQVIKLPVLFVSIPHPQSFTGLLVYLYCKNPVKLAKDLMPLSPPVSAIRRSLTGHPTATKLAVTFTDVALLRFASLVHGVWQILRLCVRHR